jgi:hypothetical protein
LAQSRADHRGRVLAGKIRLAERLAGERDVERVAVLLLEAHVAARPDDHEVALVAGCAPRHEAAAAEAVAGLRHRADAAGSRPRRSGGGRG